MKTQPQTGKSYCFLGPELGEKQEAIASVRQAIQKSRKTTPEETVFYAGETRASDMAAILLNGSLFSEAKLFLIKNAEQIKDKNDVALLVSCLASLQSDTTVILISDAASIDRNLEGATEKRIFWELYENRKTAWVSSYFAKHGCRIGSDGIAAILELVENNTSALEQECSRLIGFLGSNRTYTLEEVETYLAHSREETAFALFSRIASGDCASSVETLHTLLEAKETPQSILPVLAWGFRRFRDYLALTASGMPDEAEFRKIGLGSSRARGDYAALSRRYASADSILSLIAEFELLTRSQGSSASSILMDLLVVKLASGSIARKTWFYY